MNLIELLKTKLDDEILPSIPIQSIVIIFIFLLFVHHLEFVSCKQNCAESFVEYSNSRPININSVWIDLVENRIKDIIFPDSGILYNLKIKTILISLILSFFVQYLFRRLNKWINSFLLNRPKVIPYLKRSEEAAKNDLTKNKENDYELSNLFEKEYLHSEKLFKYANSVAEVCFSIAFISILSASIFFFFDVFIGFMFFCLCLIIQFNLFRIYLRHFSQLVIRIKTLRREKFEIGEGLL